MKDYKEKYENLLHDIDIAIAGQKEGETKIVLQNLKERNTESEDERIRKALIQNLKERFGTKGNMGKGLDMPDVLTWLEKQGKQKYNNKVEQEEDVELTDFESALFSAFSDAWQEYLSGKEVNVEKWAKEHSAELLEVAREQKPAWSEEEEARIDRIINVLDWAEEKGRISYSDWEDYVTYVKSLKPQNKQNTAWSEDDEKTLNTVIEKGDLKLSEIEWLKSLKERYTWKPSEKQMNQLGWVAEQNKDNIIGKELMSFYQDLKKLREE